MRIHILRLGCYHFCDSSPFSICVQLLVDAFRKVAVKARAVEAKRQAERDADEKRRQEVLRKKREQEEKLNADVTELTDEEAERLQKELDAKK